MHRLICGDVLDVLPTLGRFKLAICDPPDNIGLGYDEYKDTLPPSMYVNLFGRWIESFARHADIVWISFNAKWIIQVCAEVERLQRTTKWLDDHEARLFIQSFTFGQNRDSDCGNGYRPLLRLKHREAQIYPDSIRVESWRQRNGDKRACPKGRVPLDHWDEFPRVTGNSKQRRAHHPTQLHEGLIERIIKFSTLPGDAICDVFSGTGTVLRAVNNLTTLGPYSNQLPRNPITSIELDPKYCLAIAAEHGLNVEMFGERVAA